MREQRIFLGEMRIDNESPIDLFMDLPACSVVKKAALLKDRLKYLLDTRFSPSSPEKEEITIEEVTKILNCSCRTVLRMIRRGELHVTERNEDIYFCRTEVS